MKKISTFLLLALLTLGAFAYNAAFTLDLPKQGSYRLVFDGKPYLVTGNKFSFDQFPAGTHQLQVEQLWGINSSSTIYAGLIYFETNTRIQAGIDAWGRLEVTKREPMSNIGNPPPFGGNPGYGGHPWGYSKPFVNDDDYKALLKSLKSSWYDSNREELAIQAIKHNNYSAAQVKGILETFWYDSYKINVAKEAYKYSRDKGNFFRVTEAFYYASYGRELTDFMKSYKE